MNAARLTKIGIIAAAGTCFGADFLRADFEADPIGPYTRAQCKISFPGVTWDNGLTGESRVSVVAGGDTAGGGRAIRVSYPFQSLGPGGTNGNPAGGAQWKSAFGGDADTLYARYRFYVPDGFDWVKGGKLPGLCGSQCNTGGNPPTGTDGWSARLMWRAGGSLVQYLYYPGQGGTYGTDLVWKRDGVPLVVETGRWHEVQVRICLNTPGTGGGPGASDGRVTGWYDGALALDSAGFRFRDLDTMHIDNFYFSTFFGGSTNDFRPTRDERIFFDDFAVSDSFLPLSTSSVRDRPIAAAPRVSRSAAVFDRDWIGSTLVVRDRAGRNLSALPIRAERMAIPQGLPKGLVILSVPGRDWRSAILVL